MARKRRKKGGQTVSAVPVQVATGGRQERATSGLRISPLKCGSGSAWVKNQTKAFRVWWEIRRGRRKGSFEIEILVATKHGVVWRKVVVGADAIRYLPREAGPYQPGLIEVG